MEKLTIPLKPFKPSDHANCKGHGMYFLDCDYRNKEDRETFDKVLAHYEKTRK